MVRILGFHCWGLGSITGRGTEILQATQRNPTSPHPAPTQKKETLKHTPTRSKELIMEKGSKCTEDKLDRPTLAR